MDSTLLQNICFLKAYSIAATLFLIVLVFFSFWYRRKKKHFKEISVERINIVEADGKTRMVISNKERFPSAICCGKTFTRQGARFPGMVFYNEKGDENGGLKFGSQEDKGRYFAGAGMMFDQYNQDQVIGISYEDDNGQRNIGLTIWDRPTESILPIAEKLEAIQKMKDGADKTEAMKEIQQLAKQGELGVQRLFAGRQPDGSVGLILSDSKGKQRVRILIGLTDVPRLELLDENGKIIYTIP